MKSLFSTWRLAFLKELLPLLAGVLGILILALALVIIAYVFQ